MFYQQILEGASPYVVNLTSLGDFGEHRHGDVEINYCIEGSFNVIIDKKHYEVAAGQFSLVEPMRSHEYKNGKEENRKVLTIIVGISFLKKYFTKFSKIPVDSPVFTLDPACQAEAKLIELFRETAALSAVKDNRRELLIQGNLYKICDYLIEMIDTNDAKEKKVTKDLRKVENVEKALSLIYDRYAEVLTVDSAAQISGYGKSNFCKIFKSITGDTFHNILNQRRTEVACNLLSETNLSIAEIAQRVGLCEPKTFCRVFKSIAGITPGTYRKEAVKARSASS